MGTGRKMGAGDKPRDPKERLPGWKNRYDVS